MSRLLKRVTVCLLHKIMFIWSSYCAKWTYILLLITAHIQTECAADCLSYTIHKTLTNQAKHADSRKANSSDVAACVYLCYLRTYGFVCVCVCVCVCVYASVRAFNGMLISLIRQWVKQCGWDYWPACQPHWPLRWRPLKHDSLLVPKTLTASFISATPSAPPAASAVIRPAIIKHVD